MSKFNSLYNKIISEQDMGEGASQDANLNPSVEPDMVYIPSVNDEQAYDQFVQKFLEQGGSKTIANFLKNTDVDFSDKGNNEPVPTLNGLLKASKLKMKSITPGVPDYDFSEYSAQALRYTAGVVGAKFARELKKYMKI